MTARYWEEPYAFKPDRFLGDWPRDAFLPFSAGARSCLGRRYVIPVFVGLHLFSEMVAGFSRQRASQS